MLSDFAKSETGWVEAVCRAVADAAPLLVDGQDASFQNKTHLAIEAAGFGEKSSRLKLSPACGLRVATFGGEVRASPRRGATPSAPLGRLAAPPGSSAGSASITRSGGKMTITSVPEAQLRM